MLAFANILFSAGLGWVLDWPLAVKLVGVFVFSVVSYVLMLGLIEGFTKRRSGFHRRPRLNQEDNQSR
jgi:membrane protein implicated in regulation of membrane protease activity